MREQFYDLSIDTLDDGTIRLEQRDYCGESMIVDLHPQQVLRIANGLSVGTHQAQPNGTAERIATLERRLCWMRDRFDECYAALPSDFYERCGDSLEFGAWLDASVTVATEFCADFPDAPSIATSNALASPLEAPSLSSGEGSLPSIAGFVGERPEHGNLDLFVEA